MSYSSDGKAMEPENTFLDGIPAKLAGRQRRELRRPRSAAVLVPIVNDGGPQRLILTRRTNSLPTHKGQVAFPGGVLEPCDTGAICAALREAEEEIGLRRHHVEVIGLLDDFPTIDEDMSVTPVVARVEQVLGLKPQPEEVARIFEIPIDLLRQSTGWVRKYTSKHGRQWPVFYFEHDGETLWGLSAYVVLHLLDVCWSCAPFELPQARIE